MNPIGAFIFAIIILFAIFGSIIYFYILEPKTKREVDDFLNGIIDIVYTNIKEQIDANSDIDIKELLDRDVSNSNINEDTDTVVNMLIKVIYDSTVDIVLTEVEKNKNNNFISKLAYRMLTREYVEKFVSKCFDMYYVKLELNDLCVNVVKKSFEEEEETESEYLDKFSGPDYVENSEDVPLEPVQTLEETLNDPSVPEEEKEKIRYELDQLNPQSEEEKDEFDEVVEADDFFYDSKGRKRDKKTGRYTK